MSTTATLIPTPLLPADARAAATVADGQSSVGLSPARSTDIVLAIWREWREACAEVEAYCLRQQRIETDMIRTVGIPHALVLLPGDTEPRRVVSTGHLNELAGRGPETAELRARAVADLAAHQARWEAADAALGYSESMEAEAHAAMHERALAAALITTPARTLAGIAAKLEAILSQGECSEECEEFPWPEIRSVRADIIRMSG